MQICDVLVAVVAQAPYLCRLALHSSDITHLDWAGGIFLSDNKGDKLLLNCRAKFQRSFHMHVKLQCCHGNFSVPDYKRNLSPMILAANQMVYS